ncbi:hypothetical protein Tco_1346323 [Tanacetum coccineum]
MAKAGKPPTTFDELMSTPIDFSTYVLHNLKIENLKQEHLVGPAFSLLKGTCKSRVELKFHFEECYKAFKEGDFPRLNLRDIEDMLLLLVQKNLSNLEKDDNFELNVALRMFTRRVVILKWVEDLQLGVKSYQKKLNITMPETFRLMRSDDLYKFCDGTLSSVRRVLHDIASSLEMDYLPKIIWSKLDKKRSRIVIKAIDQQLFERRLMRNLEKFIGEREYGNDFRLLERTIRLYHIVSYSISDMEIYLMNLADSRGDLPRDIPLVSIEVHRNRVNTSAVRITMMIADIED